MQRKHLLKIVYSQQLAVVMLTMKPKGPKENARTVVQAGNRLSCDAKELQTSKQETCAC